VLFDLVDASRLGFTEAMRVTLQVCEGAGAAAEFRDVRQHESASKE
jgi:hypothetical protein